MKREIVVMSMLAACAWLCQAGCKEKPATPEPQPEDEASEEAESTEEATGESAEAEEEATGEEEVEEAAEEEEVESEVIPKKVVMVIACKDFRDEELTEPKEILEEAGHKVTVASKKTGGCKGMKGLEYTPDMLVADIAVDEYDAMVFVGGTGAAAYYEDEEILDLVREADDEGLIIGAICLAPGILAEAGILDGIDATAYDAEQARTALEEGGAEWTGEDVTVDGVFVTANGPEAATAFGEKLTELLK